MIANRRFSWHATLWQGGTHARAVQSERRRLACDHRINELLRCALTCYVAVGPNETAYMIKIGDALFERQICEPGGSIADRV